MPLTTAVLVAAIGLLATAVLAVVIRSRHIRGRLLFSAGLLAVSLGRWRRGWATRSWSPAWRG